MFLLILAYLLTVNRRFRNISGESQNHHWSFERCTLQWGGERRRGLLIKHPLSAHLNRCTFFPQTSQMVLMLLLIIIEETTRNSFQCVFIGVILNVGVFLSMGFYIKFYIMHISNWKSKKYFYFIPQQTLLTTTCNDMISAYTRLSILRIITVSDNVIHCIYLTFYSLTGSFYDFCWSLSPFVISQTLLGCLATDLTECSLSSRWP